MAQGLGFKRFRVVKTQSERLFMVPLDELYGYFGFRDQGYFNGVTGAVGICRCRRAFGFAYMHLCTHAYTSERLYRVCRRVYPPEHIQRPVFVYVYMHIRGDIVGSEVYKDYEGTGT